MRASHSSQCAEMAINVRTLNATDAPSAGPLFSAYLDFYGLARRPSAEKKFLEERFSAPDSTALGVFAHDQMVGFALCHHVHNSLRLAPAWILHDLFVDPACRRQGLASTLIEAVHDRAKAAGACEVVLNTAHDNRNAQALYETLGYKPDTEFRVYVRDLLA